MPHCPRCHASLFRSHTRWYERVVRFFTARRPYRCMNCRWRGWKTDQRSHPRTLAS